ncbi:hypothetical protein C8Q78DRAFT_531686 [Trametes maxima]|nr:hypothetical protein C8Q78DRAFT_531686 [Trametes maxima]
MSFLRFCKVLFLKGLFWLTGRLKGPFVESILVFLRKLCRWFICRRPCSGASSDGQNNEIVHLSWTPFFLGSPIETQQFNIHKDDAHYALYHECMAYLQQQYLAQEAPQLELDLSHLLAPGPAGISERMPSCFATLIILLVDKYPQAGNKLVELVKSSGFSFDTSSLLDFFLEGALHFYTYNSVPMPDTPGHEIELPQARADTILSISLSRWLQLTCLRIIYVGWHEEFTHRGRLFWSPLPWSGYSQGELRDLREDAGTYLTCEELPVEHIVSINIIMHNWDPAMMQDLWTYLGRPVDIPWLHARHDGYVFCSTLTEYTQARAVRPRDIHHHAAIWVSAMTFGLLEAVTRTRIPEHALVVPGKQHGEVILSGQCILKLLFGWIFRERRNSKRAKEVHARHGLEIARLLQRALNALDECQDGGEAMKHFTRAGFSKDTVHNILSPIVFTLIPLCYCASAVWPEQDEINSLLRRFGSVTDPSVINAVRWANKRLQWEGWCPYAVNAATFLTTLRPSLISTLLQTEPYLRSVRNEHKNCNESACTFYTIEDVDTYTPLHVHPSCSCEHTKPPLHNIMQILQDGVIPVMVYEDGLPRVLPVTDDRPYVAFSHVWADGMGSTSDHGLPTCVVNRLARLARSLLPDSGAFWLDSLCIPAAGPLRKQAILLMAQTYKSATMVLVIDQQVRRQCSKNRPWLYNLLYIATSGWMRRIWTLQEGLLARQLYFEFVEGPVDVEQELGTYTAAAPPPLHEGPPDILISSVLSMMARHFLPWRDVPLLDARAHYHWPGLQQGADLNSVADLVEHPPPFIHDQRRDENVHSMFKLSSFLDRIKEHTRSEHISFSELVNLVRNRTTTRPEDEIPAVSSLLLPKIDLAEILSIDGNDVIQRRMKQLLLRMRDVPKDFPMHSEVPRLTLPRFTWAPRALATAARTDPRYGTGVCTEDGLLARYYVAQLDGPVTITSDRLKGTRTILLAYCDPSQESYMASLMSMTFRTKLNDEVAGKQDTPLTVAFDVLLFLDNKLPHPVINPNTEVYGAVCTASFTHPESVGADTPPKRLTYIGSCTLKPTFGLNSLQPEGSFGRLTESEILLQ